MKYIEFSNACNRGDAKANDVTHFFSCHFSVPAAFICYRLRLTPNQVTSLFLVFGIISGVALYYQLGIVAYLVWRLHIILDMADGNLARATQTFSSNATGFDRSNHIAINTTVLLAPIAATGDVLLANVLVVTFFLYYFFYRNYIKEKVETRPLTLPASVLRHTIGIEGYILVMAWVLTFNKNEYIPPTALIYSFFFMSLFLIKLYRHLRK